jgi:hypothetical protein
MALHPEFPQSPYEPLVPSHRWFPADETLRASSYEKLLPPLVAKIRDEVFKWRQKNYGGASGTTISLLRWWFDTKHLVEKADGSLDAFRYYFAQREAVESLIWLYDVRRARDKFDLLRFDASGAVSSGMFDEDWPRYVLKMATGSGKTKVLSLLITWSYFHRLYETGSDLSRNFLLIAPNIIVLDRLRADFDGLRIFFNDPVLPANGHDGRNWRDDFQVTLHIQDDVRAVRETGNIFLTNIHRVFLGDVKLNADWRVLATQLGHYVSAAEISYKFSDQRQQKVYVDENPAGAVLRLWSVILGPAATTSLADGSPLEYAWERNRLSDLVGFSVDNRGRLIGETWIPVAVDKDLFELHLSELARACDWHELRLTGSDSY